MFAFVRHWLIYSQLGHLFTIRHCRRAVATPTGLNAKTTLFAFFSMKAAEPKCQNLIVKKVCQVEHYKTSRKASGPELGLQIQKISATDRGEGESIRIIIV